VSAIPTEITLSLQKMHEGQLAAHWALKPCRFKALRCGRRFGKTEYAKTWIAQALIQGWECAWLAPQHKTWSETFSELVDLLRPILKQVSKGSGVLRLQTGGRLDFWTLENAIAGRGRRYRRIVSGFPRPVEMSLTFGGFGEGNATDPCLCRSEQTAVAPKSPAGLCLCETVSRRELLTSRALAKVA
jgi:hypothetical protein